MGYFSNGTEGDFYEAKYCNKCIHEEEKEGCPVWLAHLVHNYGPSDDAQEILNMLIPQRKDKLGNGQCLMFKRRES